MRLEGKCAVITGGSSGIGLATARLFIEEGAQVALLGRNQTRLDAAIEALGDHATAFVADVAAPDTVAAAMRKIGDRFPGIDILFANAGVAEMPALSELTENDFDALIGTNVKGVVFAARHALPLLCDGGSIVLTGSVAALKGRPGDPVYAASKGAVRAFGRSLAMDSDLLKRRIRVNVVTPGATATPLTEEATANSQVAAAIAAMVPMGRWGEAREVAEAVLFLASNAGSYITGAEITVDGGWANA
jgi:NAD(P)-dependent dehydrogenase (short-subunit alcohol dehydrogenase family)